MYYWQEASLSGTGKHGQGGSRLLASMNPSAAMPVFEFGLLIAVLLCFVTMLWNRVESERSGF